MHHDIETSLKYANMVFTLVELSEIQGRRNTESVIFFTILFLFAWYLKVTSLILKIQSLVLLLSLEDFFSAQFTRTDQLNLIFFSFLSFPIQFKIQVKI